VVADVATALCVSWVRVCVNALVTSWSGPKSRLAGREGNKRSGAHSPVGGWWGGGAIDGLIKPVSMLIGLVVIGPLAYLSGRA
jgi:hypothetical protein